MRHLLSVAVVLSACSPTPDYEDSTEVDGIIFKGPLVAGASIRIQPIDDALQPVGQATTSTIDLDSGRYSAVVDNHAGLVRVTASGELYDEAIGDRTTAAQELSAYALITPGTDTLHLNLLGDLSRERVEALVGQGTPAAEAIGTAQDELVMALGLGGLAPSTPAHALDVYVDTPDAGWLLGASGVLSDAGATQGGRAALMDALRDDLRDDASFDAPQQTLLRQAEASLDPDRVVEQLRSYLADLGLSETLPDPGEALDSDGDGVPNTEDVCPYVSDPDQVATDAGWGVACDTRFTDIDASAGYACGVLDTTGEILCWDVEAGGRPPRPDQFPTPLQGPWLDGPALAGSYARARVAPGVVCGVSFDGDTACWTAQAGGSFELPSSVFVTVSTSLICIDTVSDMVCHDHAGVELFSVPGDWHNLETMGGDVVCAINDGDELLCFDTTGAPVVLPGIPTTDVFSIDGVDDGPVAGVVTEYSGEVHAVGDLGIDEAAVESLRVWHVGEGVVCGFDVSDVFVCLWDQEVCPDVDPTTFVPLSEPLEGISYVGAAGRCVVCGIDPDGLPVCAP